MKYPDNKLTLKDICSVCAGEFKGNNPSFIFSELSLDSRNPFNGKNTLFVALQGNKDGHAYIAELIHKGVKAFLVERIPNGTSESDANFIVCKNTLTALQNLSAYVRGKFKGEVIALTGSNGKTIVKEWLNILLGDLQRVVRSPKSFNSQIGVPLSLLQLESSYDTALIEAGISQKGEMERLADIIRPNIGILTHMGAAHAENFASQDEKLVEKLKLFGSCRALITAQHDTLIEDFCHKNNIELIRIGGHEQDFVRILSQEGHKKHTSISISYQGKVFGLKIPFTDRASVENALLAFTVALYLGGKPDALRKALESFMPVEMRFQIIEGENDTTIISDVYNSDIESAALALGVLSRSENHPDASVVISDVLQYGLPDAELYAQLGRMLAEHSYKNLICVGENIGHYKEYFPKNAIFYRSTHALANALPEINFANETILLKGASSFDFGRIASLLQKRVHDTLFEVNLSQMIANLNFFRSMLRPDVKTMCMVKARSYGHGDIQVTQALQFHGVDYFGVAFADEGMKLRQGGITTPIIVMNPEQNSYRSILMNDLEPEIYSERVLHRFIDELDNFPELVPYPIHIKLDTGMNRLGFNQENIDSLIKTLKDSPSVKVSSVFTHMVASEDENENEFTLNQLKIYSAITDKLERSLGYPFIRHALNSCGIVNFPHYQFDMVRLGLGLYGYSPLKHIQEHIAPCGTLMSVISQIKTIHKGESVSYNRRFIAQKDVQVATIPIGYADGINRRLGYGNGYVVINGHRAPVLGTICMDTMMVDVTGITCEEGDTVTILGKDPTAQDIASILGTIPYEVLTGIAERVKRVYMQE